MDHFLVLNHFFEVFFSLDFLVEPIIDIFFKKVLKNEFGFLEHFWYHFFGVFFKGGLYLITVFEAF